jgi:Nucleotidyltransferase of unknown function (DUF6036)
VKDRIVTFLTAIDEALAATAAGETLDVYHIGRSALVWEYDLIATTSDIDILQPKGGAKLVELALSLFGRGTDGAKTHSLYLDVVNEAFPPMPGGYEHRARRVDGPWKVLKVYHLDPYDLAASKLRRFAPKDREDIRQLCDLGHLLDPKKLEEILEKAYHFNLEKDGDEFRDTAFEHLRIVQRYLRGEIAEF